MGVRGEVFSSRVILPNRTYFFNVKENRMGDLYLNIVESKNRETGGFDRQSVILFADDLPEFLKGFDESLRVLEKSVREKKRGGEGGGSVKREERPERGERADRGNRPERREKSVRGEKFERGERSGRSGKFGRGDKDNYHRADGKPSRGDRDRKGERGTKSRESGHGANRSRPDRDRPERGSRGGKRVVVRKQER
jgi:hypothetical protein